ncbi:MAG TPA: DnaB-like helicase N-terminal domain-containing protein [Candidatus Acidoferrales bacterium]|nr:DnaB-like helicase N-terminal domain-containing protein [Candidatus Acidoferrales bacterium]
MKIDPALERPLPYNAGAERSVLGAILLDNHSLEVATEKLKGEDFFLDQHRRIFARILELAELQQGIDLITLSECLDRYGELESAGGPAYLSQLMDGLPRATNVEHYAQIVKRTSMLRRLAKTAAAIQEQALDYVGQDADVILADASARIAVLCANVAGPGREPAAWREIFHTFADFEDCPELSFAIGGFLQNAGATMIGGLSGHGKTLILCSIARALLAGKGTKLWDIFPVEENAVRVVYLIPECSLAPFKHRLKLFRIYNALAPNDERLLVRTLSKGPTPCLNDPRILFAVKGAHVILDTAVRFAEGDENSATEIARGLANDIFALLGSGARSVIAAHHSPKPFARENTMRLENVLRGSGDVGAMLTTAWAVKQIDATANILHIENIKPRDFQPCGPFQIIGRPYIDDTGDFQILKRPGECGALMDEQEPERDRGGAPQQVREARAANIELLRQWLCESPSLTSQQLSQRFDGIGIKLGDSAIRKYRKELGV